MHRGFFSSACLSLASFAAAFRFYTVQTIGFVTAALAVCTAPLPGWRRDNPRSILETRRCGLA